MKFRENIVAEYIGLAPSALVFERVLESRIYRTVPFERPILDLGCGEGLFAKMVFTERIDTGVDPNRRELERARELGAYVELIQCYGHQIPKPDASYRTVFSNSVLEHIEEVRPVLREIHRVLAPGGRFHFTAPSPNFERYNWTSTLLAGLGLTSLDARWRAFFNRFWAHYNALDLAEWEDMARDAGFDVEESRAFAPRRTCMLNSTLTPLGLPSKIFKRLSNRWTLFPRFRRLALFPLYTSANSFLNGAERNEKGGLVFLSLRKPMKY